MHRHLRHAATLLAVLLMAVATRPAAAQDSFLQRFFRAGSPSPQRSLPRSIRHHRKAFSPARVRESYAPQSDAPRRPRSPPAAQIKPKSNPSTTILVIGDDLADMMAGGIDQEFADNPDVQVIRRSRTGPSLIRTDGFDWIDQARKALAASRRVDVAVVLLGTGDWQPISSAGVTLDPGSDAWKTNYGQRVDALLDLFKDKKVPLVWVGLPPMRSPQYADDMDILDLLIGERVRAHGDTFVALHDAFVDEDGKYADSGPALNGVTARLRAADGVNFTRAGALKAAYFADVEVKRILAARPAPSPEAASPTPSPGSPSTPGLGMPANPAETDIERIIDEMARAQPLGDPVPLIARLPERPAVGPLVPLTAPARSPDGLLASPHPTGRPPPAWYAAGDLRAPKPGRADDFAWRAGN